MSTVKLFSNVSYSQPPINLINQFLACYNDMEDVRRIMQEIIDTAMTSPQADSWTREERADAIFFCKLMTQLAEAVMKIYKPYLLAESQ
ncbi:hypothetical protein [Chitinophaga tropicalis]|uniref:Uncharacterized protein n=1 Tax=Chitinophaga tropicalis TaxID=2683588 RepID=A0A7K1TZX9_9BACT|nr:hypothetical protein [Chitinophaga tropicalis]MVT07653.1 hypothetical protein [Chitinophaga tropicalis]